MESATWIYAGLFAIGMVLFVLYARSGKLLRCFTFTAVTGLGALGALWVISRFTPITAAFTPFTLLTSALLGVPGVAAMLLLQLI